jgi:hypothetical protein
MHRYQGNCQSSPLYGQAGQVCRDFWVRKSNRGGANHQKHEPSNQHDET